MGRSELLIFLAFIFGYMFHDMIKSEYDREKLVEGYEGTRGLSPLALVGVALAATFAGPLLGLVFAGR